LSSEYANSDSHGRFNPNSSAPPDPHRGGFNADLNVAYGASIAHHRSTPLRRPRRHVALVLAVHQRRRPGQCSAKWVRTLWITSSTTAQRPTSPTLRNKARLSARKKKEARKRGRSRLLPPRPQPW
jgi:hypothetical protein